MANNDLLAKNAATVHPKPKATDNPRVTDNRVIVNRGIGPRKVNVHPARTIGHHAKTVRRCHNRDSPKANLNRHRRCNNKRIAHRLANSAAVAARVVVPVVADRNNAVRVHPAGGVAPVKRKAHPHDPASNNNPPHRNSTRTARRLSQFQYPDSRWVARNRRVPSQPRS